MRRTRYQTDAIAYARTEEKQALERPQIYRESGSLWHSTSQPHVDSHLSKPLKAQRGQASVGWGARGPPPMPSSPGRSSVVTAETQCTLRRRRRPSSCLLLAACCCCLLLLAAASAAAAVLRSSRVTTSSACARAPGGPRCRPREPPVVGRSRRRSCSPAAASHRSWRCCRSPTYR